MEKVQAKLKIYGKVQGVFYRDFATTQAKQLGLSGFVKNMSDGTVEIAVQGPKDRIQEYIKTCHQGSPSAKVESIKVEWQDFSEEITGFKTEY